MAGSQLTQTHRDADRETCTQPQTTLQLLQIQYFKLKSPPTWPHLKSPYCNPTLFSLHKDLQDLQKVHSDTILCIASHSMSSFCCIGKFYGSVWVRTLSKLTVSFRVVKTACDQLCLSSRVWKPHHIRVWL